MNKEELLKEAKLRYPVGCEFKSAYSFDKYIFKGECYIDTHIRMSGNDKKPIIYNVNTGKWAEIVSYPKNYIPPTESILKNVIIW